MRKSGRWIALLIFSVIGVLAILPTRRYVVHKMDAYKTQLVLEQAKEEPNYAEQQAFKEVSKSIQLALNVGLLVLVFIACLSAEKILENKYLNELEKEVEKEKKNEVQ